MQVHHSIDNLPPFRNAVVTIGTFDGVHMGHRMVIGAMTRKAKSLNGESVIITFHPHPRHIINTDKRVELINTLEERIILLSQTGIDHLVIIPFTAAFAEQEAEDYIAHFLVRYFQPKAIIIGYDHRFGKGRKGDFALLQSKAADYGYELFEIPKHLLDTIAVSSTKIRASISQSRIEQANSLLGYLFFFEGVVVKGDQLGRELGYPTANLEYTDVAKIHLGHGVYAAYAEVEGVMYRGMLSIGNRPTLIRSEEKIEINIFDFDRQVYGQKIKVIVKNFLRPQEKYESLEALKAQLLLDKEESLRRLEPDA